MPRGFEVSTRALAGLALLLLVSQCSSSSALSPAETSASAGTTVADASVGETTASADTPPAETVSPTTGPEATTRIAATTISEPTTTTVAAAVMDPNCPNTPHGAVVDRDRQLAWLCENGVALSEFVITSARYQPDPATYKVFEKSMNTSSRFGGHYSTMTHFVAFAHGEQTGARVAFHTVPVLSSGEFVQPLASVGTQIRHGDSSGCIRVLPEQGPVIWDWLQEGDEVRVVT